MHHSSTPVGLAGTPSLPLIVPTSPTTQIPRESEIAIRRVLHVINGQHFSGAERVQQLLGKRLDRVGFAASFACVKPDKFPELSGLDAERVFSAAMANRCDLRVVEHLARRVRQERFELLHAHTPRTALVTSLLAIRARLPWIYHVHSPTARDSTRGMLNRINQLLERLAITSCTHVITVSRSLRREMLSRGVRPARLSVVPNGVPAITPIDAAQRMGQAQWRIGLIALMRPRKGVEVALQAFKQLKRQGAPLKLELIGGFETPHYQQQTLQMIKTLGLDDCVCWSGFTSDIASAIRRLDALLLPSLFGEGMPMVVLEALAAGVPVVATRVEGTPEVIRDGIEGFLADPGDAESLQTKLLQLIADRREWCTMSARALQRHRENFSDSLMAARVAAVYRRVLD